VARKQQHRKTVDGRPGCTSHHVRRAWPNRSGAHKRSQAVAHFREPGGRMHHGLLIAAQVVGKIQVLLQGLPDPSHIAMAEDAETTREERVFASVARYALDLQELDDG